MKIQHILGAALLLWGSATASAIGTMRSSDVSEIAAYCYPANVAQTASAVFMPDGIHYAERTDDGKKIVLKEIASGKETGDLFDIGHTRETVLPDFEGFNVSPDGSKLLVWRNQQSIYRRSFSAEYYVYELRSRMLNPLSKTHSRQQVPLFSPDSRMVAFVAENNIYIAKLDYETEVAATTDGEANRIINGATDWTYEEEFTTTSTLAWAPDNLTLCYVRFDESNVPLYTLPVYEGTCDPRSEYALYPGTMSYKYPVAGAANSTVSLHSYDIETRKTKDIVLPGNPDYIPRIVYGPKPSQLLVATLNRDQNRYEIFSSNPKSGVSRSVYTEESKAWIEPEAYEALHAGENSFVVAGASEGYTRFYEYSYAGAKLKAITPDNCDATAFYGSDAAGNYYYQAAAPTPIDRTVYRLDRKGAVSAVSRDKGTSAAVFSPGCSNMILSYSNIDTPPTYTVNKADGKELRVLEDNKQLADRALPLLCPKEFFTFRSGDYELNGFMIKPRDFSSSRRYPVIMSQYSGPGSQSVLHKWSLDWEHYFASKGYVVICVDGRGTGGRGTAFRYSVYKDLGNLETVDQVAAARYAASLPYVDPSRIGIYGWSFGGYEALMCASADDCPYAAAVSVAPVTDWRYYDSVYTERYMLTPQQNEAGYRSWSAILRSLHLACPLLIMYGTSDDNVHPANALQYVSTLQSAGILCDMFVFPNMNHSINGCNARSVVFAKMLQFFDNKLKK